MMRKYKNIVDDAQLAVDAENMVLASYGKEPITLEFYLAECEMPIIKFYRKILDIDNMDFSEIAERFMLCYEKLSPRLKVFPEVRRVTEYLEQRGYTQAVVSGFESGRLKDSLTNYGLAGRFAFMSGSDDTSCADKTERAAQMLIKHGMLPEETLFVGDMYHDCEAAQRAGADCVLIAKGHQGKDALMGSGVDVLDSAEELMRFL